MTKILCESLATWYCDNFDKKYLIIEKWKYSLRRILVGNKTSINKLLGFLFFVFPAANIHYILYIYYIIYTYIKHLLHQLEHLLHQDESVK